MERKVLFPGSFDPFTKGHKYVVDEALGIFDKIVIAVGINSEKKGLLTPENRVRLIRDLYKCNDRIEVIIYDNLTGEICRQLGITVILRGLRNSVDYEYERNITQINESLFPELRTVLLFTPPQYVAISSSIIRELISFGKDPVELMPHNIHLKSYM